MTGSAHWLWLALASGVVLTLAVVLFTSWRRSRALEIRTVCLHCPSRRTSVVCQAVRHRDSGIWTGVRTCSAFDPPEAVSCAKDCLDALDHLPEGARA